MWPRRLTIARSTENCSNELMGEPIFPLIHSALRPCNTGSVNIHYMPSNLFSPLTIRNMTLKNRLVVSPMQQYSSPEGIVGSWHLVHLGSRAVGGAALIITECTAVSPEARNTVFDTGMWNDEQAASWQPIVDFVHQQGAKMAMQLWHAG